MTDLTTQGEHAAARDYAEQIGALGLRDKVTLLTGASAFTLAPCPAIGLGELRLSDGPTGVRGLKFSGGRTVALFPNATLLASSWSEETAYEVGWRLRPGEPAVPGEHRRRADRPTR